MRILFDTNVVLDVLLARHPFARDSATLFDAVEHGTIFGLLCANSMTTLFYLVAKARNRQYAAHQIGLLLDLFDIAPVNRQVLDAARHNNFNDYEDAVIHESAIASAAEGIVTRNPKDFTKARITVHSPHDLLIILKK